MKKLDEQEVKSIIGQTINCLYENTQWDWMSVGINQVFGVIETVEGNFYGMVHDSGYYDDTYEERGTFVGNYEMQKGIAYLYGHKIVNADFGVTEKVKGDIYKAHSAVSIETDKARIFMVSYITRDLDHPEYSAIWGESYFVQLTEEEFKAAKGFVIYEG